MTLKLEKPLIGDLLIALAYATAVLQRTDEPRGPSHVEEDRRMAARCWALADQVKAELFASVEPAKPSVDDCETIRPQDLASELLATQPRKKLEELCKALARGLDSA